MHDISYDRTFRQKAMAYGAHDCVVTVNLDGALIYQGSVLTQPEPAPMLPNLDLEIENIAWQWQDSVLFTGHKLLEITVTGATLILAKTEANIPFIEEDRDNTFSSFYSTEVNGVWYYDPLSAVTINDVPQVQVHRPDFIGQRWWRIPPKGVLRAKLNIIWLRPPGGVGVPEDFPLL